MSLLGSKDSISAKSLATIDAVKIVPSLGATFQSFVIAKEY